MRRIVAPSVSACALMVSGCGFQTIRNAHSNQPHDIALLWRWMLAAATIVFLGAAALLIIAWFCRGSPGL
jgi:heme/copper-type cytochrome/quinol oxidase subunit 2